MTDGTGDEEGGKELSLGEKITKAGVAGTVSYIVTELGFWAISIPFIIQSYHASSGDWLDISNAEERAKIIALTLGFVSTARLAVPLRLGFALLLSPTVGNILTENKFLQEQEGDKDGDGGQEE